MIAVARDGRDQVAVAARALAANAAESVVGVAVRREERNRADADEGRHRPAGFRGLDGAEAEAAQRAPAGLPHHAQLPAETLIQRADAAVLSEIELVGGSAAVERRLGRRTAAVIVAREVLRLGPGERAVDLQPAATRGGASPPAGRCTSSPLRGVGVDGALRWGRAARRSRSPWRPPRS